MLLLSQIMLASYTTLDIITYVHGTIFIMVEIEYIYYIFYSI